MFNSNCHIDISLTESRQTFDDVDGNYDYIPSAITNPTTDCADRLSSKEILFLNSHGQSYWEAANQNTLMQVFILHRHGDRTPIEFYPKDNLASEPFWQLHGPAQLTQRGRARLHALGQIIRQRYNKFLTGPVNKNSILSYSSGATRCVESAKIFLTSLLASDTPNGSDVSELVCTRVDNEMLNVGAPCNIREREYAHLDASLEFRSMLSDFEHERRVLEHEYGLELDRFYKWAWVSSLLEIEHSYFGLKMRPAVMSVYLRMQQAGDRAMKLFQMSHKMRKVRAGLLINDLIENMNATRKDSNSASGNKFVHYSAHDMNLAYLMGILGNDANMKHRPDYAANIILELHEDNGEWFIKLFYMSHVPTKPVELPIGASEWGHEHKRCNLEKFTELIKPYRVASWHDWMKECGNPIERMDLQDQNT